MVTDVDSGCNEFGGFGVGSRNEKHLVLQDVQLETSGDQSRHVLGNWNEDLACLVTALVSNCLKI